MVNFFEMIFYSGALFLLILGFADAVTFMVSALFDSDETDKNEGGFTLVLKNADTAEYQLRHFLWQHKSCNFKGELFVKAKDRESYVIAGKILRKYPNIGLLYQEDLNYNI